MRLRRQTDHQESSKTSNFFYVGLYRSHESHLPSHAEARFIWLTPKRESTELSAKRCLPGDKS